MLALKFTAVKKVGQYSMLIISNMYKALRFAKRGHNLEPTVMGKLEEATVPFLHFTVSYNS